MSAGLLLLRLVIGGLLVGHGTQKLYGWFGGPGREAAGEAFAEEFGYRDGRRSAELAGWTEAGAGALLILGLFTPFAAAAILGVMVNAIVAVHRENGLWNQQGGYEYPLVLAVAATALGFTGAGAASLDRAFGLGMSGLVWGLTALLLGATVGSAVLATRNDDAFPLDAPYDEPESDEERRAA